MSNTITWYSYSISQYCCIFKVGTLGLMQWTVLGDFPGRKEEGSCHATLLTIRRTSKARPGPEP